MSDPADQASRRSDEIEAEIATIRSRMDRTLGEIEQRLQPQRWSPDRLLRSVVDGSPHPLTDAVRRNPVAAALIGVGVVWLAVGLLRGTGGTRRRPIGERSPLVDEVMGLVGVTRVGTRVLRQAGVALQDEGELGDLLRRMAEERGRTAALLQDELQQEFGLEAIHGEPLSRGSRSYWDAVERAITRGSKGAILRSLEEAEEDTVKRFRAALHRPLPEHVRVVIGARFQEVLQSGHSLGALRQAVA